MHVRDLRTCAACRLLSMVQGHSKWFLNISTKDRPWLFIPIL